MANEIRLIMLLTGFIDSFFVYLLETVSLRFRAAPNEII